MKKSPVPVERCNGGVPILSPVKTWWESGVTFNAAALYLERSTANDSVIQAILPMKRIDDPDLARGVVAVHYRARPETDPGLPFVRSFVGLAVFTPDFRLLHRFGEPVVFPEPVPDGFDFLGIEDPRITRIGETFYMVYCGLSADPVTIHHARLCLARSGDLLHWEKLGPMKGEINATYNKDGVLFSDRINGKYFMLHRPWWKGLAHADYAMRLATSENPEGQWKDLGEILHAYPNPAFTESWVGAGSVPIPAGQRRYIVIYHTGNSVPGGELEYDLDVALFDMTRAEKEPASVVRSRIEHFMVPETPEELGSSSSLQVQNVLFTCGSYEYGEFIYVIYGGADTYTLAARVRKADVLNALEKGDLRNPFVSDQASG